MQKSFALAAIAVFAFAQAGPADEKDGTLKVQAPGVKVEGKIGIDRAPTGRPLRASKIIGAEVKNGEGTALGKVDDIVMDEKGNARYFVMTHGGVLGVGQKYCAVPFRAVAVKAKEDSDARWIQLNISPKTLEKAPTFVSDKWPDFNDGAFTKETDTFFLDAPGVKVRVDR
jgi:sporulation protein YlmC with PRC-barrel domain